jgi:hypothetical protein
LTTAFGSSSTAAALSGWDSTILLQRRRLVPESEVFLRRDWLEQIVSISRLKLNHINLFRPATIDLVLSKMMRGNDEQDMADADFMIRHDCIKELHLINAFSQMKPIELVELRDAFERAKPVIMKMARDSLRR